MVYLFYNNKEIVDLVYYVEPPFDIKKRNYLLVNELEEPKNKKGYRAILKANSEKYWYDYVKDTNKYDAFTEEEIELDLENKIVLTEIVDLIEEKDLENKIAIAEIMEILNV